LIGVSSAFAAWRPNIDVPYDELTMIGQRSRFTFKQVFDTLVS